MSIIDKEVTDVAITYLFGDLLSVAFGSALAVAGGYYVATTSDRPIFRRIAGIASALVLLHASIAFADIIRSFGAGFGDVDRLYSLSPTYVTTNIIGSVLACLVQSFYAWRVYRLLGNRLVLVVGFGLLITFAFASTVCAQLIAYNSSNPGMFMVNAQTQESFLFMRLPYIAAISIDVFITGFTLYALYKANALGSEQGVGRIVGRLVVLTVTSNALTTGYCILLLILSMHSTQVFWALTLPVSDCYMLTLLVWLYGRRSNEGYTSSKSRGSGQASSGSSGSNTAFSETSTGGRRSSMKNVHSSFAYPIGSPKKPDFTQIHISSTTVKHNDDHTELSDFDSVIDKDLEPVAIQKTLV